MKKNILILLLSLSLSSYGKQKEKLNETPPNIIIILVDDLGKEWLSCYGAEDIETPNIDKLAQSGTKFNNVYAMPQCTPTRVTLLTGQYPFRHGWVNHWDVPRWGGGAHFDETLNPALTVEMKNAGYKTCIAGKWQIDDFRVEPDALNRMGFDEYCMWTGYETGNPAPTGQRYNSPYIFTKNGSRIYEDEFGPDIFKDFVCDFIRSNKDNPMFIYYPMVLTHAPYEKTPADSAETRLGKFKAMVKYTDLITADIVNTLEQEGIRENTLIIWTTDNGTSGVLGKRKGRIVKGGKSKTTEVGVCLPFIVSWPSEVESNTSSDALIDFTDILPTCLDLAGADIGKKYKSGNKEYNIDGVSFSQVLKKNRDSKREWILSMGGGNNARLTENGVENEYVFRDRVIRNKRFKIWINTEGQAVAFYDLLENPEENINLIDSLNNPLRKKNFKELYKVAESLPDKDADPIYDPNPAQEWDVDITARSRVWKK